MSRTHLIDDARGQGGVEPPGDATMDFHDDADQLPVPAQDDINDFRSESPTSGGDLSASGIAHAHIPPHLHSPTLTRALSRERRRVRRQHRRLVHKNGQYNLTHAHITQRRQRYLADIFTTMLDMKWRWNLLMFVMAFIISWLLFALLWWLICFSHGDLDYNANGTNDDRTPCVDAVYDFTTALLFSIETQHTIGYGGRATTPQCPEAIILMMAQSCLGVIIQAMMTGVVFAKLSRSKKRAETLMFSKHALISKRDGRLCLLIRLGDMRKSNLIDAHCRGILIKKRVTSEGESLPLYQYDVTFGREDADNKLFLVWPTTLEHVITEDSPFWGMSREDFLYDHYELLIVLEGTVESTGTTAQARTSYLPGEILWGRRFQRLVTFQKENGQYTIDYSQFHASAEMPIPACSARELQELQASVREAELEVKDISRRYSTVSSLSGGGGGGHEEEGGEVEDSDRRRGEGVIEREGGVEGVNAELPAVITYKSISTQTDGASYSGDKHHSDDVNNNNNSNSNNNNNDTQLLEKPAADATTASETTKTSNMAELTAF